MKATEISVYAFVYKVLSKPANSCTLKNRMQARMLKKKAMFFLILTQALLIVYKTLSLQYTSLSFHRLSSILTENQRTTEYVAEYVKSMQNCDKCQFRVT